jgi:hypothetical protein
MLDLSSLAAWSTVATAVLVLVLLLSVLVAGGSLLRTQRRQAGELARLRQEVVGLRKQLRPDPAAGDVPRIGGPDRVFQVGDTVTVTAGLHRGDMGTVAERPDWLKPGYVCVDLSRARLQAYIATSKLEPLTP